MTSKPSTVVRSKTAYHHGDLRAQLIAAAAELVETHGPDGFSVSEAARRAGVSSAAPYKHFRDRDEILRGVAAEAMDRLAVNMRTAARASAGSTLEAVAAVGQAYIDFARFEPGVFRLVFGLTEGHEEAPELLEKGRKCFAVVAGAAARCLGLANDDPDALRRAYLLWAFVHGHSFLTIDKKNKSSRTRDDDWAFLLEVSRSILGK
ncbi:MAG: TetR/AcrR family transcriptional regulator [Wenzhouxiangella sp.]